MSSEEEIPTLGKRTWELSKRLLRGAWEQFKRAFVAIWRWEGDAWTAVATFTIGGITIALAIYGSLFTLGQWQRDKALDLQKRWSSPEMQARHDRVVDGLLCRYGELRLNGLAPQEASIDVVTPGSAYAGLDSDISAYVEFFDEARTCIDTESCNARDTCRLFHSDAVAMRNLFASSIERQRLLFDDPNWGHEIAEFAAYCEREHYVSEPAQQTLSEQERSDLHNLIRAEIQERNGPAWEQREAACRRMRPENVQASNRRP